MIKPFQNESDTLAVGELTVENRLDRIDLYGSLAITKDQAGLRLARELKALLDATVAALENAPLPERIAVRPAEHVDNPFRE